MKFSTNYKLLWLLTLTAPVAAADRAPLFQEAETLKAVLTAPIAQAYEQRDQDVRIYLPGHFTYADKEGESQRLDVSIRTRGNFRREHCQLPPLQLNFKKSQVKGTHFKKQDKLKLVAPCNNSPTAQQYVLREYLAYRIYEILTEKSLGTRLMRLGYIDSDEKLSPWTDLVFVIEDEDDLAKRLDLDKVRVSYNKFDQLDQPTTALAELFQLMIGNNDYSVMNGPDGEYCCHNVEMFADAESADKRVAIPYDFDFSGLVHAEYASPPEHLDIESVRTRYYRGLCQPRVVLDAAVEQVRSKRDEIMTLVDQVEGLSKLSKRRTSSYLKAYFKMLDNEDAFKHAVLDHCRGMDELLEMTAKEPATASY